MRSPRKVIMFISIFAIGISACSTNNNKSENLDSAAIITDSGASAKTVTSLEAEQTDSLSQSAYEAKASDTAVASRIRKVLPEILKKELTGVDSLGRKFVYFQADLNGDKKDEYFVGFTGMNWCGSGGCTALLLSSDYKLITQFTVVSFPFIILGEKTKGWSDLAVHSGGGDRLLKWNGRTYPKNPSVVPKYQTKTGEERLKALSFAEKPYPWFKF